MSDIKQVNEMIKEMDEKTSVVFSPSDEMRRLKAKFLVRAEDNPLIDTNNITKLSISQLTDDPRIDRWWGTPGFKNWFSNQDEFAERLEFLSGKCLDVAMTIIADEDMQGSARVNCMKQIFEMAKKFPQKSAKETFHDKTVQGMSKKELESYIRKNATGLITEGDVPEGDVTEGPVTEEDLRGGETEPDEETS